MELDKLQPQTWIELDGQVVFDLADTIKVSPNVPMMQIENEVQSYYLLSPLGNLWVMFGQFEANYQEMVNFQMLPRYMEQQVVVPCWTEFHVYPSNVHVSKFYPVEEDEWMMHL